MQHNGATKKALADDLNGHQLFLCREADKSMTQIAFDTEQPICP